ncbi:MAG: hypothetical protein H6492_02750 [Candidatus Paracaedibacteraceae bacterium]|nr:hypothetical protein [Candidatus Paracaedibacteraceae bacterium]
MKKNSLLLITFLTLNAANAATNAVDPHNLPPFATDVSQSHILTFDFSAADKTSLCRATVTVHPTHLDVIFHTLAEGVRKGWIGEEEILSQLRRLINEVRTDLAETPFKDFIYRP